MARKVRQIRQKGKDIDMVPVPKAAAADLDQHCVFGRCIVECSSPPHPRSIRPDRTTGTNRVPCAAGGESSSGGSQRER